MKLITKENIKSFMSYYHDFHDSHITSINYDINNTQIIINIDVFWSGEPTLKEDNKYETNKTKLKIIFNNVEKFNNQEIFSWDEINNGYMDYITIDDKEYICFATDKENPLFYVVCESIEYEELK